jgi:hypothetical protein
MSSVFTKTVAVDWDEGIAASDLPALALIAAFATAGVLLSQASYRGGGLAAPLATLTVVNPVVAAAVGITMFGETFRYGSTGTALALSCGVVAAGGLILLTTERIERTPHDAPAALTGVPGHFSQDVPPVAAVPAEPEPDTDGHEPEPAALSGLRELMAETPVLVPDAIPEGLPNEPPHAAVPEDEPVRYYYGSFYGGAFVPVPVPVVRQDRHDGRDGHRTRVTS